MEQIYFWEISISLAIQEYPEFYVSHKFITMFTTVRQLFLS